MPAGRRMRAIWGSLRILPSIADRRYRAACLDAPPWRQACSAEALRKSRKAAEQAPLYESAKGSGARLGCGIDARCRRHSRGASSALRKRQRRRSSALRRAELARLGWGIDARCRRQSRGASSAPRKRQRRRSSALRRAERARLGCEIDARCRRPGASRPLPLWRAGGMAHQSPVSAAEGSKEVFADLTSRQADRLAQADALEGIPACAGMTEWEGFHQSPALAVQGLLG